MIFKNTTNLGIYNILPKKKKSPTNSEIMTKWEHFEGGVILSQTPDLSNEIYP